MNRRSHPRPAWLALVVLAVLVALGLHASLRRFQAMEPWVGVEWVQAGSGVVALQVHPGSPAWAAGLRPGDQLERLDGRPAGDALDVASAPWDRAAGEALDYQIRRGSRTLDIRVTPQWRPLHPGSTLYGYLCLVGLAFVASAAFVGIRWPAVRGAKLYMALSGALFGWFVFSPTGTADLLDWTALWLDTAAAAAAPAILMHLSLRMTRRPRRMTLVRVAGLYMPSLFLFLFSAWSVGLGGAYRFEDPVLAADTASRLQLLYFGLACVLSVAWFSRAYSRSPSALRRSQMRWMLWGLAGGLLPFTVLYVLPWALGAEVPAWAEASVFPMLVMPASFTAALVRYRLHDLDSWARKVLIEATAVVFGLGLYGVVQFLFRREALGLIPLSNSAARYLGIVVVAFSFWKIRQWSQGWLDRAFYRKRYSYRATLLDWARELNAETHLSELAARVRERVRETLGVAEAGVFVRTAGNRFQSAGTGYPATWVEPPAETVEALEAHPYLLLSSGAWPEVPWARHVFGMRVKGRLTALLLVSERDAAEEPLSFEDRALLSTLSAQTATAIEAARLVDALRTRAQEVARLQAQQEKILESAGVGLAMVDPDGRILAWNRALEGMVGVRRSQVLGRRLSDVFPRHLVRALDRAQASASAAEEIRLYRYTLADQAGVRRVFNLKVSPPTPEAPHARVLTFDDVTERVRLEEQVLQQERLAALGFLAAGVAHEVNTPLTGISSYAQMLMEEFGEDDPRRELLAKIEAQTRRASKIANSLLNMAQPDRSDYEDLDINDLVQEVVRLFEPHVKRSQVRLEARFDAAPGLVRGHRGKLQQVLLNLLLNARDAVGEEGTIQVRTSRSGEQVLLEVRDDGQGIQEEDLPRIFDPFFTTKGLGRGTGLGLSISYSIVREHGGNILVDSRPGEFTCFQVLLPLSEGVGAYA